MNPTKGPTSFSIQRAAEIVCGAFAPCVCDVKTVNVGTQIEFEVIHNGRMLLHHVIPSTLALKSDRLRSQSVGAREIIEHLGVKLDPWQMPSK